jgi:hypothetical protein
MTLAKKASSLLKAPPFQKMIKLGREMMKKRKNTQEKYFSILK